MRPRWWLAAVAGGALAFTLLVSVTSVVSFAYRSPSLHVAVETAAALISLLAAQLIYGRFRRSLDRRDLLLASSLALFAAPNLLFSAVPAVASFDAGSFATWAPALSTVLAAGLFAAGAFTAPHPVRRPRLEVRRAAGLCALCNVVAGQTERTSTADVKSFGSTKLPPCTNSTTDGIDELLSAGSSSLRYDTTGGQFIQNWKTGSVSGDTCYRVALTTQDGSAIYTFVKLRK